VHVYVCVSVYVCVHVNASVCVMACGCDGDDGDDVATAQANMSSHQYTNRTTMFSTTRPTPSHTGKNSNAPLTWTG